MKDIPGYEGRYSIDENGNIFSYRRQRFLKSCVHKDGYLGIGLYDANGKRKNCKIHRLVALTYLPNPNNLPVVDHIDRNKLNNSVENLRWVTISENSLNVDLEKMREHMQEMHQACSQVLSKSVEMRDKNNHDILIKTYPSTRQAAIQEFGDIEKNSSISKCARGELKSAYGYFWTYVKTEVLYEEET